MESPSSAPERVPQAEAVARPRESVRQWYGWTAWPRSLFGRLFVSVLAAVFVAQAAVFTLVAREHHRFVAAANVREWSRRIVDLTDALAVLDPHARGLARARLERIVPSPAARRGRDLHTAGSGYPAALARPFAAASAGAPPSPVGHFRAALERELQFLLGPRYGVAVYRASDAPERVIAVSRQPIARFARGDRRYDVHVVLPDGDALRFRVVQGHRGPLLPHTLVLDLILLTIATALVLYAVARSITRPLSRLALAAEAVGRDVSGPSVPESGAAELREAARAFNTMQERMHRYLDSRTRVLAAMSHDLKTPLTRMRLRVETLADAEDVKARFGRDLDEMERMVHSALALLKGLNDDEPVAPIDLDALLAAIRDEFAELGASVTVEGRSRGLFRGRPQALKRCLTNLVSNAVNFGTRATVHVQDGVALRLCVRDMGPGLPPDELERVFEPFYRVESSRNRDTGGTGLGLSIARDIAQAHGGTLILRNLPHHGLEAELRLPRARRSL